MGAVGEGDRGRVNSPDSTRPPSSPGGIWAGSCAARATSTSETERSVPAMREPAVGEFDVHDRGLQQFGGDPAALSITLSIASDTADPPMHSAPDPPLPLPLGKEIGVAALPAHLFNVHTEAVGDKLRHCRLQPLPHRHRTGSQHQRAVLGQSQRARDPWPGEGTARRRPLCSCTDRCRAACLVSPPPPGVPRSRRGRTASAACRMFPSNSPQS